MDPENSDLPVAVPVEIPTTEGFILAVIKDKKYQPPTGFYFW